MNNLDAAKSLISQALEESDIRKAHFLLDAAYKLDNTIPVDSHKKACTDKWISTQRENRPVERKQVGFIL